MPKEYVPYEGPIVTFSEAKKAGLALYFTGKPCKHGHLVQRRVRGGCIACSDINSAAFHKRNPEKVAAWGKNWRQNNPERVTENRTRWIESNPDAVKAIWTRANKKKAPQMAEDYRADPETVKKRVREWCQANPEARRAIASNYSARKRGAEGSHTADDIVEILALQNGKCAYCRKKLGKKFHIDHIKSLHDGGSNHRSNLQATCGPCNQKKNKSDPIDFARRIGLLI